MKLGNMRNILLLSAVALVTVLAPYAHAGCGQYRPASFDAYPQHQLGLPYLLLAASDTEDGNPAVSGPTMVGTWKEQWISVGSKGIPDGTEIDAGYAQWHSDGTEINLSGLRSPLTGNVCLGVWKKTGPWSYQMNHFGISYDTTGVNLVGPARIQQWLVLAQDGLATSGKFTIDQYDEAGNLLAHLQGKIVGTRVTMETGFEKLE